ncbi:threonine--tRNA ligase catalytic subunit [Nanobdella aerobiophila]|uniref:Threonine--tRNA ligase catalytic subunit n=1 Tax=Nanobdella aerobiophila TaxID=2586965 RepID=A0A915SY80_9ARCH|nr:aminoacyl--tRNA ligase-related protein [Nanobdella aerobiophila]BBL45605.1 threonine--tRNA ligase catalytic subunit [Nanobdella aerobiophila]
MDKDHIDIGDELDILARHDRRIANLNKNFGDLIGKGLQLFSLGGGLYYNILSQILTDFYLNRNYYIARTPIITNTELYNISGHLSYYKDNMYIFNIEEEQFSIKPMNCPHHILIFINILEKYRKLKLPFRIFELGTVHRYEPSGSVYGLLRVRSFTQDDSHIFILPEQLESEIEKLLEEMILLYDRVFLIDLKKSDFKVRLSLHDPNKMNEYSGKKEDWEYVENIMRNVMNKLAKKYNFATYEGIGEAAFYGPKFDFTLKIGEKEWQLGTIQLDFNLPRNFRLLDLLKETLDKDNLYIIHKAYIGSIERFSGAYLESFKGRLPFTLNPIQIAVVKIKTGDGAKDKSIEEYSNNLYKEFVNGKLRAVIINSSKVELSNTIRILESSYKPSIIIYIGEKETKDNIYTIKYYNQESKNIEEIKGDKNKIYDIINKLEKPVYDLNGRNYRIYEDFNFIFE